MDLDILTHCGPGAIGELAPVTAGNPAAFTLATGEGKTVRKVEAAIILVRSGLSFHDAKHAIEQVLAGNEIRVALPVVENPDAVTRALATAGVVARETETLEAGHSR